MASSTHAAAVEDVVDAPVVRAAPARKRDHTYDEPASAGSGQDIQRTEVLAPLRLDELRLHAACLIALSVQLWFSNQGKAIPTKIPLIWILAPGITPRILEISDRTAFRFLMGVGRRDLFTDEAHVEGA